MITVRGDGLKGKRGKGVSPELQYNPDTESPKLQKIVPKVERPY